MKRTATLMAALAAILTAAAAPVRTATENFVTNKISQAVASAALSATNYTDSVVSTLREGIVVAAAAATNYTDTVVTSATNGLLRTETDPTVSSWAKAASKPSYILNEICPAAENWLGVQGNAGRHIKVLAGMSGGKIVGGLRVTASTMNDNNMTTYTYDGVEVKRNGTATDYLFDTSSQSGIVRRSELAEVTPGNYSTVSNKAVNAVQTSELNSLETDPTVPQWAKAQTKPTYTANEVSALPDSYASLTNNVNFTNAVAAVSPPADLSDCVVFADVGAAIPSAGICLALSESYAYFTNTTETVEGGVTNIVTTVTTNSYPVVSLYKDGTKVWTSDPADASNYGWLIALVLALVGGAGTVLWKFFGKSTYTLKVDPETGGIYYDT